MSLTLGTHSGHACREGSLARVVRRAAGKQPVLLLDPRDREALLAAGTRLLLEGLGADTALELRFLNGGGRDRCEDIRRSWAGLGVDEALAEMRCAGLA